ncbi:hypothetical protein E0H75_10450 [Kribbella capetownensis]|uniref:VOC domain-containing protein n=1 Tax=Kribbella capetownensis TaxID=1572659 RepID=A0A4R0JVA9_9ACTN|nr:VOC family protein [Kribbella capetownensis]TCC50620.1 hypothetical protein E0H75_10450 [Kribbella capetownensis]
MDSKLEAVVVPVTDVDRTRHFYRALGFRLDVDEATRDGLRVVQLTPPSSVCSIIIGTGITPATPGSFRGQLTVPDLEAARAELLARGASPSAVIRCRTGCDAVTFDDPDGNQWLLVEGAPLS